MRTTQVRTFRRHKPNGGFTTVQHHTRSVHGRRSEKSYTVLVHGHYEHHPNVLTARERAALPNSDFAEKKKRKYPVEDVTHARNDLGAVKEYGTTYENKEVRHVVHKRYPSIGKR
jgi:hypothetical protein